MSVNDVNSLQNANIQAQKKSRNSVKGTLAGIVAGTTVPTLVQLPTAIPAINGMSKIAHTLTADEVVLTNQAAEKILQETGLAKKGVEIVDGKNITPLFDKFKNLRDKFKNNKLMSSVLDMIDPYGATKRGKNAYFNNITNQVVYNKEKLSPAAFHEIGHAFNFNNSKFWKAVQKMRMPAMITASAIAIFAACTRNSKPKDGEELTGGQKTKNFIRNNAGKLAFASMLPVVAEEVMASVRGCKWAKKLLDPSIAKKVLKTNILGGTTYVGAAIALGIGAKVAKDVKDKIQAKKDMKANA